MGVSPVLPGLVLPIDMNKDLVPVARFVQANWGIAVPKNSPYATLADLIADAKKKPGVLNYGHSGVGSLQQLAAEWLAVKAGIKMQGIAYRGTGPAIIELMGGRIDLVVTSLGDFSSQAKGGELRVLTLIDDTGSPQFPMRRRPPRQCPATLSPAGSACAARAACRLRRSVGGRRRPRRRSPTPTCRSGCRISD